MRVCSVCGTIRGYVFQIVFIGLALLPRESSTVDCPYSQYRFSAGGGKHHHLFPAVR